MINDREEEKMSFDMGRKIKELRRNAGITQEKTAEALGVTTQAVSRWESGSGCPDIMTIPALANFFGVTIDDCLAMRMTVFREWMLWQSRLKK